MKHYLRRTLVRYRTIQQQIHNIFSTATLKQFIQLNRVNAIAILCLIVTVIFLGSCKEKYPTYENSMSIRPAILAEIDTPNYTTIIWEDSVKNFGKVTEGDSIKVDFHFQNTGKKGLFFLGVQPSCGCTDVNYPDKIILPGEKGSITATFSSIAQPIGVAVKSIIVKTNTSNDMRHALVFKGEIVKKPS